MAGSSIDANETREFDQDWMPFSMDETMPSRRRINSEPSLFTSIDIPDMPLLTPSTLPANRVTPRHDSKMMSDTYASDLKCSNGCKRLGNAAKGYCRQCCVYLCSRCLRTHEKGHNILRGDTLPGPITVKSYNKIQNSESSTHHKVVEKVCCEHGVFCCATCVEAIHSGCNLQSLEEVCTESNHNKLKYETKLTLQHELKSLMELRTFFKDKQSSLANEKEKLCNEVEQFTGKLIKEIKRYRRIILTSFASKLRNQNKRLEERIKTCERYVEHITKDIETMDKPKIVKDSQQKRLTELKSIKSTTLKRYKDKREMLSDRRSQVCSFEFVPNTNILNCVTLAGNIGVLNEVRKSDDLQRVEKSETHRCSRKTSVNDTATFSDPLSGSDEYKTSVREQASEYPSTEILYAREHAVKTVKIESNTVGAIGMPRSVSIVTEPLGQSAIELVNARKQFKETRNAFISDICCWMNGDLRDQTCITAMQLLDNGSVLLVDSQNHRIKLFEIDDSKFEALTVFQLESEPRGIAKIDANTTQCSYVVTTPTEKSIIVLTLIEYKFQQQMTINVDLECTDVAVNNNEIILVAYDGDDAQVITTDIKGNVQRRLVYDATGKPLFKRPNYLCVSDDSDILYVSDADMGIYGVLINDLTVVNHYKHRFLLCPMGLTLDAVGHIIILGGKGHPMHRLSKHGMEIERCQIDRKDAIKNPQCICFLPHLNEYLVACDNSYDIVRIKVQ